MKQNVKIKNRISKMLFLPLIILISCKTTLQKKGEASQHKEVLQTEIVQQNKYKISDYKNNKNYFIRNIDINKDGILDKVVCSEKFKGNELLFFQKNKENYNFVIKTINFSEDGGRIIDDVLPTKDDNNVLKIKTFFPDGGLDLATYFIAFKNGKWKLQKTIYETRNWQKDATKRYICEVKQDILLSELVNNKGVNRIKQIPNEEDREKKCKSFIENK